MTLSRIISLSLVTFCLIFYGCKKNKRQRPAATIENRKELLIYCENTMLNLVMDLKQGFEQKHNCKITIQHDCAKNLMGMIKYSSKGDLYIPASAHSFENFISNTGHQLTDTVFLAYNHLVYMVKKGNSIRFNGQLHQLKQKGKVAIIIANPETSSLGSETRHFLQKQNAYKDVLQNVVSLTLDAKGLVKGLNSNKADVAINWRSNIQANSNKDDVAIIEIEPALQIQTAIPVYAASLSCSSEPELSKAFLEMALENLDEDRLKQFGFAKRQTIIF